MQRCNMLQIQKMKCNVVFWTCISFVSLHVFSEIVLHWAVQATVPCWYEPSQLKSSHQWQCLLSVLTTQTGSMTATSSVRWCSLKLFILPLQILMQVTGWTMCLLCDDTGERRVGTQDSSEPQPEELWNNYICHLHNENVCMQDIAPKQLLPHRCRLFLTNRILIGPDPNSSSTSVELGKMDSSLQLLREVNLSSRVTVHHSLILWLFFKCHICGFAWSVYPAQAIIQYYWIANGWIDVSMVTYKTFDRFFWRHHEVIFFFYCLNNLVYICKTEDTPISLRCAISVLVIVMKHNALMYLRIG